MTTDHFTIAAVQMKIAPDREANLAKAEAAIAEAAKHGAQVVCLPELFTGYYFCQKEDIALFDLAFARRYHGRCGSRSRNRCR